MSSALKPPASAMAMPMSTGHSRVRRVQEPRRDRRRRTGQGDSAARPAPLPRTSTEPTTALPVGLTPLLAASHPASSDVRKVSHLYVWVVPFPTAGGVPGRCRSWTCRPPASPPTPDPSNQLDAPVSMPAVSVVPCTSRPADNGTRAAALELARDVTPVDGDGTLARLAPRQLVKRPTGGHRSGLAASGREARLPRTRRRFHRPTVVRRPTAWVTPTAHGRLRPVRGSLRGSRRRRPMIATGEP